MLKRGKTKSKGYPLEYTSGMVFILPEPEKKSARENIDAILYGHVSLGDFGNFGKIKFALYELLERIEQLEKEKSE